MQMPTSASKKRASEQDVPLPQRRAKRHTAAKPAERVDELPSYGGACSGLARKQQHGSAGASSSGSSSLDSDGLSSDNEHAA